MIFYHLAFASNLEMMLRRPDNGCPYNTYEVTYDDSLSTAFDGAFCLCEDYCSWKGCKLEVPPSDCLSENKGVWLWDSRKQIVTFQVLAIK